MSILSPYPVGNDGQAWGDLEKSEWRSRQRKQRSYTNDVLGSIDRLRDRFTVVQYGELDYLPDGRYPLYALRSSDWDTELPIALVTGGVHGYETSGMQGAFQFAEQMGHRYMGRANLLIAPCVSPWGYEYRQRWNPFAIDPNRSFFANTQVQESATLLKLVKPLRGRILMHIDLHETTNSDETEFRPALAARDGKPFEPGTIPDGFYLVDDCDNPQPAFQQAIIAAVAQVTPIARADPDGTIIGAKVVAPGVIRYDFKSLGLCAGISGARYTTTTEVYPDSPHTTAAHCSQAQGVAVNAALEFALAH